LGLAGVPVTIAALGVSWLSSAAAAVLSALLFRDRRIGWAMAIIPPSFLTYSTLAMSEASLLALVALGMYCVVRRDALVAGALALGFAGLVRPVACFAVLARAPLEDRLRLGVRRDGARRMRACGADAASVGKRSGTG